jgi:hypothetical protein
VSKLFIFWQCNLGISKHWFSHFNSLLLDSGVLSPTPPVVIFTENNLYQDTESTPGLVVLTPANKGINTIRKTKKPILFKVTEPSSIPYRTHPVRQKGGVSRSSRNMPILARIQNYKSEAATGLGCLVEQ